MSDYTLARYEFNIGAGIAHDFWVLERINPGGTPDRLAAIHGIATDANGVPQTIGLPGDGSTIKAHLYSATTAEAEIRL